jgi:hypothetical protein
MGRIAEWFVMWFQNGQGRTTIHGRAELRKLATRYSFDADEVINRGETFMLDDDGETVGGVFHVADPDWFQPSYYPKEAAQ